ncbi:hypothetical protein WR25_12060 [Diploscapter pachys]|uniref:Uncharacterized protein n=1 Tax=Diploscapter pachys TaxID=2018661 RepID=A0A2A2K3W1_9BILA|nr:hypothetical protein WR25_12060 [Diploscapter pachys]
MIDPVHVEQVERLADVLRRPLFPGMRDQLQPLRAGGGEDARELFGRMADLGRIEAHRSDPVEPRRRLLQRRERLLLAQMAQEAHDQRAGHAMPRFRLRHRGEQPLDHLAKGNAARRVSLRIEHDLGMHHAVRGGPVEIGSGQIVKVGPRAQHVRPGIIDVEEILQVGKGIGRAHRLHRCIGDRDTVALGQREHQLGLQTALDVQVQLGLGQGGDEILGHSVTPGTATETATRTAVPQAAPGLPAHAARHALERPRQVRRDPPAIEAARLRDHLFAIDQAAVERPGVERDMVAQDREAACRIGIAPGDIGQPDVGDLHMPVHRMPLPFAEGSPVGRDQHAGRDIGRRDVPSRRMAGLQRPDRRTGVCHHDAAMLDADVPIARLRHRGSRKIPDALLARTNGIAPRPHARASRRRSQRCRRGRTRRKPRYARSSIASTMGLRAAMPSGRSSGIARHIAAKAAAPDNNGPSPSRAWKRASIALRSIGQLPGPATSTKSIRPRRSSRRIMAISRRHSGHWPSCHTIRPASNVAKPSQPTKGTASAAAGRSTRAAVAT